MSVHTRSLERLKQSRRPRRLAALAGAARDLTNLFEALEQRQLLSVDFLNFGHRLGDPSGTAGDRFGYAVAAGPDIIAVGAYADGAGSVSLFRADTGERTGSLPLPANALAGNRFGISLGLSGDTLIVGMDGDDDARGADVGSAYLYSATTRTQIARLTAPDGTAGDRFGLSVAISGNYAIVGAFLSDVPGHGADSGAAYIFSATTGAFVAKLTAADGLTGDWFGYSVAIDGDTAVVGAVYDDTGANGDQGSAYVFKRSGAAWPQQIKLTAADGADSDWLGISIAVRGNTVVAGASLNDSLGSQSGAAYVFNATTGTQSKLLAPDGAANDLFGAAVAICDDYIAVGAYNDDSRAAHSGSAYIFHTQTRGYFDKLTAPDGAAEDYFGYSLALSNSTLVVGAYNALSGTGSAYTSTVNRYSPFGPQLLDPTGAPGDAFSGQAAVVDGDTVAVGAYNDGPGSVYLFSASTGSPLGQLPYSGNAGDRFGLSVGISGGIIVVGADGRDDARGQEVGAAYLFNAATRTLLATLTAPDGQAGDRFGLSVAISGNRVIVGAFDDDDLGATSGSAYLFDASTGAFIAKLRAPDGAAGDWFGYAVDISGPSVVVGAVYDDDRGVDSGSAYLFNSADGSYTGRKLLADDGASGDLFGGAVSIRGDTVVVGAYQDDRVIAGVDAGAAYVYSAATGAQRFKLTAPDGATDDNFGVSVAAGDAFILVGSYYDDDRGSASGSAYLFHTGNGEFANKLVAPDGGANHFFGRAVSQQGSTGVVGASGWTGGAGAAYTIRLGEPPFAGPDRTPIPTQTTTNDQYGFAVSLSDTAALVGSPFNDARAADAGAAYLLDPATGATIARILAPDGLANDLFGSSVAIDGAAALVASPGHDSRGSESGAAYLFNSSTGAYSGLKLLGPGSTTNAQFGFSVALSGGIAIIGSPGDASFGRDSGAIYAFTASTGAFKFKITAPDGWQGHRFGSAVAISDGIFVVGSPGDEAGLGLPTGSAYLFNATSGAFIAKLVAPDRAVGDRFGESVAISNGVVVVGSARNDGAGADAGAVYLFDAATGAYRAKLTAPDATAGALFGQSVSINGDYAVVGAPQSSASAVASGAAYLFDVRSGNFVTRLFAADGAPGDVFGRAVAINGNTICIAAPLDDNLGTTSGSLYVWGPRTVNVTALPGLSPSGAVLPAGAPIQEGGTARFVFTRTGMLNRALTVYYNVSGEADPSDFQGGALTDGFVVFPIGVSSRQIDLPITADNRADLENQFINERIIISLDTDPITAGQQGNPTGDLVRDAFGRWVPRPGGAGAELLYSAGSSWQAVSEIVDSSGPFVKIESSNATGGERSGDLVSFTVTRGGDLTQPLTVDLDISGTALSGVDYQLFTGFTLLSPVNGVLSLTLPAGVGALDLSAVPIDDDAAEGIEWIHAELLERPQYALTSDPARRQSRVGLIDDEMPSVMVRLIDGAASETGPLRAHFQVVRGQLAYTDQPLTANISFTGDGSTASGADFTLQLADGTVLTPAGGFYAITMAANVGAVDLYVQPVNDTLPEPDERLIARLISGSTYLNHPTLDRVEFTITDNDRPFVTIEATNPAASETNAAPGEFTFRRVGGVLSQPVEVRFSYSGSAALGIDYRMDFGQGAQSVLFPANVDTVRAYVRPIQDALSGEGPESVTLRLVDRGAFNILSGIFDLATVTISDLTTGGTLAAWDWSMEDRYGRDDNHDGRIDIRNTPEWTNPAEGFAVTFDPSGTTLATPAATFTWTIRDASADPNANPRFETTISGTPASAKLTRYFPDDTSYIVTLSVADSLGHVSTNSQFVHVNNILIVSAGDSFASGEGNPEQSALNFGLGFFEFPTQVLPPGVWADDGVNAPMTPDINQSGNVEYRHASEHRSSKAASSLSALALEQSDPKTSVTFVFVAQSGAGILDGLVMPKESGFDGKYDKDLPESDPNQGPYPESQLHEIARIVGARKIDTMLISIGGNDVGSADAEGFGELLKQYVFRHKRRIGIFFSSYSKSLDEIARVVGESLDRVPSRYALLNQMLTTVLGPNLRSSSSVILGGYPDPTGGDDGQPTDLLSDATSNFWIGALSGVVGFNPFYAITDLPLRIDAEEAAHARSHIVIPLDRLMQRAARDYRWTFAPAPAAFSTHGYGASVPWFVSATMSRFDEGGKVINSPGTAHPNAAGQQQLSAAQRSTFLGDSLPNPGFAGLNISGGILRLDEGAAAAVDVTDGRSARVGALTYEWDLDFDGRAFQTDATGAHATVSAANAAAPSARSVALRATDRLGRVTYAILPVQITNTTDTRPASEERTVNVNEPFWISLSRQREQSDPALLWRVDWSDGVSEKIPAAWGGRSRTFQSPGAYSYRVFLTDAAGEIELQGGSVSVYQDDPFPRVSVSTLLAVAGERDGNHLRFQFTRSQQQLSLPLLISVQFGGAAANGVDYTGLTGQPLPASVFFPAGQQSVTIDLLPAGDTLESEGAESVIVTIAPSSLYQVVGTPATAVIADAPSTARGSISGTVFNDVNGTGLLEPGELALADWTVALDLNTNGVIDPLEPAVATDPGGRYIFKDLIAGPYQVLLAPRTGWVATTPSVRAVDVLIASDTPAPAFGVAAPAVIRGTIFNDLDNNNALSPGESGRGSVVVWVDRNNDGELNPDEPSAVTLANGAYEITDVAPGDLLIRARAESGWANTGAVTDRLGGAIPLPAVGGGAYSNINQGQRLVLPAIASLAASSPTIASGWTLTLTAAGVDPWAATVNFYLESNGIPGIQTGPGGDLPMGQDDSGADGWSLSIRAEFAPGARTFYAIPADGDGNAPADGPSTTVNISGAPAVTRVGIRALTQVVREGGSLATVFEIFRSGANEQPLAVNLSHLGGPGRTTNGVDHAAVPQTIEIPAGQDVARVLVWASDDHLTEGDESLVVAVLPGGGYTLDDSSQAQTIVRDASSSSPAITISSARLDLSGPMTLIQVAFSADVSASLSPGDVQLRNLTTGHTFTDSELVINFDATTGRMTIAVPSAGGGLGILPAGQYRLVLSAAGLTDANGALLDGNGDGIGGDNFTFDFSGVGSFTRAWDGGGGDFLWSNPLNWTADLLPQPSDDVFIGSQAVINASASSGLARAVYSLGSLHLNNASFTSLIIASGSVEVLGQLSIAADATIDAAQLLVRSAGLVQVGGDLALSGAAELAIELVSGDQYGRVIISGAAFLGGRLVTLAGPDGFDPSNPVVEPFSPDLIQASAISGDFADFAGLATTAGAVVYRIEGGTLRLHLNLADYNADGGIDGADIEAFFAAWENGYAFADFNGDGGIDGADIEAFFFWWERGGR
ncbi:MAG: hypothetical protein JSR77_17600 [Planctomycetes bacterium]|nr:hypothetical protein [Planctomycetota bacterium]